MVTKEIYQAGIRLLPKTQGQKIMGQLLENELGGRKRKGKNVTLERYVYSCLYITRYPRSLAGASLSTVPKYAS